MRSKRTITASPSGRNRMAAHTYDVQIRWSRGDAAFTDNRYSRAHSWHFDGAAGKTAVTLVTLHPQVTFSGAKLPSRTEIIELHHKAHDECFIANSVTTDIRCEPVYAT